MAGKNRSDIENRIVNDDLECPAETHHRESAVEELHRDTRRRVLTGGIIGAPFILTLTSRPALATYCSPSALGSGNLSRAAQVVCSGLQPTWWFNNPDEVANCGIIVGPCNPITYDGVSCSDYYVPTEFELQNYLSANNSTLSPEEKQAIQAYKTALKNDFPDSPPFGTPFSDVFGTGLLTDGFTTIMQSLDVIGGSPELAAHSSAAYLNAIKFEKEDFGMSADEVVAFVQANWPSAELLETLTIMNSRT